MIRRLYIDNYKCLVNFELRLESQALILGRNGTGKSSLLEVIRSLQQIVIDGASPESLFPPDTRTRWDSRNNQKFEIEIESRSFGQFLYLLDLDEYGRPPRIRVRTESLRNDGREIFRFHEGEVHLFNDRFEDKVQYPFDWYRPALATITERQDNTRLTAFKKLISNLVVARIDPYRISSTSTKEERRLARDCSNFAAWYRWISDELADRQFDYIKELRSVLDAFQSLSLRSEGESEKTLLARFRAEDSAGAPPVDLRLDELSDGQKATFVLYALLHFIVGPDCCLLLDEPESHLALSEIQPWLVRLRDCIDEKGGQAILASHHPELIDYLGSDCGLLLDREGIGPVRLKPIASLCPKPDKPSREGLKLSEIIARGWEG